MGQYLANQTLLELVDEMTKTKVFNEFLEGCLQNQVHTDFFFIFTQNALKECEGGERV